MGKDTKVFVVRVELHGAKDPEDYNKLHILMEENKFKPETDSFILPRGEYLSTSFKDIDEVFELVKSVVGKFWVDYSLLVTNGNIRVHNLRKSNT